MNLTKQTNRFALFYFLSFIIFGYVFYYIPFVGQLSENAQSITGQLLYSVVPLILYFVWTKKDVKSVLRIRPLHRKNILLVIAFGFIIQPLMQLLSFVASLIFPNLVMDAMLSLENESFLSTLFAMAVMPAILEELLLRGIFLSGYRNLGRKKAIFWTALLFGLLHLNPQQFFYAFGAGLFFCFLVERSGSIFAAIIPHFIINGTNVASFYASLMTDPSAMDASAAISNMDLFIYCVGSALISLPFLVGIIYLFLRVNPAKYDLPKEYRENIFSIPVIFIFILVILFGVLPYVQYIL